MKKINFETKTRIYLFAILLFSVLYYLLCIFVNNDFFQAVAFYDVDDTFMDWFNCVAGYSSNPYSGETGTNYPALAVLCFKLFRAGIPASILEEGNRALRTYQDPWLIFMLYNGVLIWIFCVSINCKLKLGYWDKALFFAVCLFSAPVLLALERGNIINLAFVLTLFFFCFYDEENKVLKELAFLALAIAAAIKIYPAIFGLLLLKRRRIKECIRLVIYGVLSFIVPFFYFGGWKAILSFANGILFFANDRSTVTSEISDVIRASESSSPAVAIMPASYGYNFSFSNICRVFQEILGIHVADGIVNIGLICLSVILLIAAFATKERWKELLSYTLLMILLPSFSGAYVMLFLLIPFIDFLNTGTETENQPEGVVINSVFALLMLLLITPWALPNVPVFSPDIQPGPLTGSYLLYFLCVLAFALLMLYESFRCLAAKYSRIRTIFGIGLLLLSVAGAGSIFFAAYRV